MNLKTLLTKALLGEEDAQHILLSYEENFWDADKSEISTELLDWYKKQLDTGNRGALCFLSRFNKVLGNENEFIRFGEQHDKCVICLDSLFHFYQDTDRKQEDKAIEYGTKLYEVLIKNNCDKFEVECPACWLADIMDAKNDFVSAFKWYKNGLLLNCSYCTSRTASCYEQGRGVRKCSKKAFELYFKNFNSGNCSYDVYPLISLYTSGTGTEKNLYEACRLLYARTPKMNSKFALSWIKDNAVELVPILCSRIF